MNKKTDKKLKLPPKKMNEMKGFEEVIDGFMIEQEQKQQEQSNKEYEKGNDNYTIYDFLDLERTRLNSLETLFRTKIPNMKVNNQFDILLKKQQEKTYLMKEDIVKRISSKNSSFLTQMRQIFDQSFK